MVAVPEPAFHVLVLTEDGTKHTWHTAFVTIRELAKKLLRHLDHRCETHRIEFSPVSDDQIRETVTANNFKSRRRPQKYRLHQLIAAVLQTEGFVLHHVDADRAWGSAPRTSANETAARTELIDQVRALLVANNFRPDAIAAMMSRYLLLVPYRELEAWLYQNTEKAATLCLAQPGCRGKHAALLESWRADRSLLDEHPDPPSALCLGKAHNTELVHAYPTAEVVAAGKSLAAAVAAMLACDALLHAIQRTYETPPPDLEST